MDKMKDLDRKQINTIGLLKNRRNILMCETRDDVLRIEENSSKLPTPLANFPNSPRIPSVRNHRINVDINL